MAEVDAVSVEERAVLAEVLRAIRAVRHGSVQVIVQDGRAVQIDTLEKKRLDPR
jgi:hypothetical protein